MQSITMYANANWCMLDALNRRYDRSRCMLMPIDDACVPCCHTIDVRCRLVLNLSAIDSMHATLSRRCDYSRRRVTLATCLTRYQSWFTLRMPSIDDACCMLSMMYICYPLMLYTMYAINDAWYAIFWCICTCIGRLSILMLMICDACLFYGLTMHTVYAMMVHAIYRLCMLSICDTCSRLILLSPVCLIFSVYLTTLSVWLTLSLTHLPMSLTGLLDLLRLPYHFICLTYFVYLTITAYFTCRLFDSPCLLDSVVGWLPLSGWHTCLCLLLVCLTVFVCLTTSPAWFTLFTCLSDYFTLTAWLLVYLPHLVCLIRRSVAPSVYLALYLRAIFLWCILCMLSIMHVVIHDS